MKILFCGKEFPDAPRILKSLLPDEDISVCEKEEAGRRGIAVDVLIPLMHRLEPELIESTSARLIQQWGVGLEGVDIAAASRCGIMVCNVPGDVTSNADSTAEHALFLMLAVARCVRECFSAFHQGLWGQPLGQALAGNTALIVGLGRVGRALAKKLAALGMKVLAVRRTANSEVEASLGLIGAGDMSQFHNMVGSADFVISTIALADETRGIVDRNVFRLMKPSAYLINVSRGAVVKESDLVEALRAGKIAGAGLDVYEQEPLAPGSPLLALPNVVATPHVGGVTKQNYTQIAKIVSENIMRIKARQFPEYCVNEAALKVRRH